MIPFDANIHLPCRSEALGDRLAEELSMDGPALIDCFDRFLDQIRKHSSGGNFMLFNQTLTSDDAVMFTSHVRDQYPDARFTLLARLDARTSRARLADMRGAGIDAIKLHSYVQGISEDRFPAAVSLAVCAAELDMPIFVDASYGSKKMYAYDNLRLAAAILDQVSSVPVVILHSGGARAIEAMLLAETSSNVFLDTSFSVPYYIGSTIELDLAFAYKRIGVERVIYGSDFPYISFEESMGKTSRFLDSNGFTSSDRDEFFGKTARKIFEWKAS